MGKQSSGETWKHAENVCPRGRHGVFTSHWFSYFFLLMAELLCALFPPVGRFDGQRHAQITFVTCKFTYRWVRAPSVCQKRRHLLFRESHTAAREKRERLWLLFIYSIYIPFFAQVATFKMSERKTFALLSSSRGVLVGHFLVGHFRHAKVIVLPMVLQDFAVKVWQTLSLV